MKLPGEPEIEWFQVSDQGRGNNSSRVGRGGAFLSRRTGFLASIFAT